MPNLHDILHSPDRVLEASRAASQPAPREGVASGSVVQKQAGPSVPGTPPRPDNHTSQYRLRQQLVLTPPRPRPVEQTHKRMTSLDVNELRDQSGAVTQRPRHSRALSRRLLAPFSPPRPGARALTYGDDRQPENVPTHASSASAEEAAAETAAAPRSPEAVGIEMMKVTLEEAKKRTVIAGRQTMGMVFEGVELEHMAQLFDDDVQKEFMHVVTDCGSYYLSSGKVDTEKTVAFENYFNKDIWVMANLFRPERAQFRAREIVGHQASLADAGRHPRYLVHQRITSEDGEAFLAGLNLKEESVYDLRGEQFETFTNKISNGGFSKSLLRRECGLKIADAKLLVEVFPADLDDEASSDVSGSEKQEEPQTPSESGEPGVQYRFTVVMKTAPIGASQDDVHRDSPEKH